MQKNLVATNALAYFAKTSAAEEITFYIVDASDQVPPSKLWKPSQVQEEEGPVHLQVPDCLSSLVNVGFDSELYTCWALRITGHNIILRSFILCCLSL
jgi:hypothetical protein